MIVLLFRKTKIMNILKRYSKAFSYCFLILPFISIFFVLIFPYASNIQKFDVLLSGRLNIQNSVLSEQGVHFFGKKFEMVGAGLEDITNADKDVKYNYIDNEYIQILTINGILIFSYLMIIVVMILLAMSNSKKYIEFVFVYLYLIFSVINPRLFDLIYSPACFIIFRELFSYMKIKDRSKCNEKI